MICGLTLLPVYSESSCLVVADVGSGESPVSRRERPRRTSERQRGSTTSTLAASVGLQCPLSPCGMRGGASADWHASERLSQVSLDTIVFLGVLQTGTSDEVSLAGPREPPETDRQSLSDAISTDWSRSTPSPPTAQQKLSSLRISESSLTSSSEQQQQHLEADISQEDSDEVFLHNLSCPSPPESPVKDTSSLEDFPLPPPPPDVEQGAENQTGGRFVCSRVPLLQKAKQYFVAVVHN